MKFFARMKDAEHKALMTALDAAGPGERINVSDYVKTDALVATWSPPGTGVMATLARWLRVTLLALMLMLVFIPAQAIAASPERAPEQQAQACQDVPKEFHHTLGWSQYWPRLLSSGTVKAFPGTGDVIAFIRLAECGGRYLIAIWRGGEWNTHYLASWGHVQVNIAGAAFSSWGQVLVARSFMFVIAPCPGTWPGHPDAWTRPCPSNQS